MVNLIDFKLAIFLLLIHSLHHFFAYFFPCGELLFADEYSLSHFLSSPPGRLFRQPAAVRGFSRLRAAVQTSSPLYYRQPNVYVRATCSLVSVIIFSEKWNVLRIKNGKLIMLRQFTPLTHQVIRLLFICCLRRRCIKDFISCSFYVHL